MQQKEKNLKTSSVLSFPSSSFFSSLDEESSSSFRPSSSDEAWGKQQQTRKPNNEINKHVQNMTVT